ncbi:hypothetical protein [Nitrosopumilus sp. S6]
MNTTLMESHNEMGQLESQSSLFKNRLVKNNRRLSTITEPIRPEILTWEDLRGVF